MLCKNFADGPENLIGEGEAPRTAWLTCSRDEGESWEEPREITGQVKKPSGTWYATGPCHGIQLAGGRLVVPCDHAAYSDLCVASDLSICCLFEHGRGTGDDGLALARFDLAWLTDGADRRWPKC